MQIPAFALCHHSQLGSSETVSLTVIKEWNDEGNEANRPTVKVWKYNGSGYGWVEVQGIDVHVLRTTGGKWEDIGVVRLTADNNHSAIFIA